MKIFVRALSTGICFFLCMGIPVLASGQNQSAESDRKPSEESGGFIILRAPIKSPRFSGFPLALVGDEPVTLGEFTRALATVHGELSGETQTAPIDYAQILKRLINTRLAVEEAKTMGIDELPEIQKDVEVFSRQTLRELVMEELTKDIVIDEAEVDRLLKEFKIKAVLLKTKENAEKMEAAIMAGKDFDEAAKQMIADGAAESSKEQGYLKQGEMLPEVENAVPRMTVGSVSPVIPLPNKGFIILKLEDVRYQESPAAREEARSKAFSKKRFEVLDESYKRLSEKYLKLDQKLFDSIDFEAEKPGILNLMEDKRILVEVRGGEPVTVGEYATAVKDAFFHDVLGAIKRKKVNRKKMEILDQILVKRALLVEAMARGIDKTDKYKEMVKDYKDAAVFSAFMDKVVFPGVKVSRDDVEAYYREHQSEYSSPQEMRVDSLIFGKRIDAEKAVEELRKGTDFKWLQENAEGQVDKKTAGITEELEPDLLNTAKLPEGERKAVSGSKPGDIRLYASPEGYFYVLAIREVYPPKPQPLENVIREISKIIYSKKLNKQFEEWANKLWKAYDVRVYADDLAKQMERDKP